MTMEVSNMQINKTFEFDNVTSDYYAENINQPVKVVIDVSLSKYPESPSFSVSGYVDEYGIAGQILNTLYDVTSLRENPQFLEIYDLWSKYHLNDLTPGTPEQMDALAKIPNLSSACQYLEACQYLDEQGLLVVDYKGKPYKDGSGWLTTPIPEEDLNRILKLLEVNEVDE